MPTTSPVVTLLPKTYKYLFVSLVLFSFNLPQAIAATSKTMMKPSQEVIPNLKEALDQIKKKSSLPLLFPDKIPVTSPNEKYYVSASFDSKDMHYLISIDTTPDCQGAKFCNIGSLAADQGQRPQIYFSPGGPDLTEPVQLNRNHKGYYTPAHAEADFWPTLLEWRMDNVLYSLRWEVKSKNEKKIIIDLVNSAIQKGKR